VGGGGEENKGGGKANTLISKEWPNSKINGGLGELEKGGGVRRVDFSCLEGHTCDRGGK